ncbi:3'-5' exonuclease [Aridibaculum aurantiacum]|uniref:3'-5' exonuclease n=1 Tax=Aridibaculum aurantiacum TaxID=2810307 RepID=UPI001A97259C|nr:3'-5' exonuclease [Aridibaculum aurantiacum]
MHNYLLFIDTETSGLPKNWDEPFSNNANWPYVVQVSWMVYKKDGAFVKEENHFVGNDDFEITDEATRIHGINKDYLQQNGIDRKEIFDLLAKDVAQYQPLVVGHYIELDMQVIGADCYRLGIEHPLVNQLCFCTMLVTSKSSINPYPRCLNLPALYNKLFKKQLPNHHNALDDARATAECFFELMARQCITEASIEQAAKHITEPKKSTGNFGCALLPITILFVLIILALA